MKHRVLKAAMAVAIAGLMAAGGYYYWQTYIRTDLPGGIAVANGRLEANQIDIATKLAGRIIEINPREGEMVEAGLARRLFDTGDMAPAGWLSIVALALVCTVVPIASFLFALPRVGPGTASILSTFEVVVGVALAAVLLGESLAPVQLLGAALVIAAVVALQLRPTGRVGAHEPAAESAAPAAAGAVAHQPA